MPIARVSPPDAATSRWTIVRDDRDRGPHRGHARHLGCVLFLTGPGFGPFKLLQFIASGAIWACIVSRRMADGSASASCSTFWIATVGPAAVYVGAAVRWRRLLVGPSCGAAVRPGRLRDHALWCGATICRAEGTSSVATLANLVFAHIFCIGLPIAFVTNRSFCSRSAA